MNRLTTFTNYSYYLKENTDTWDAIQKLGSYEEAEENRRSLEISDLNISTLTYAKFKKLNPDIIYLNQLTEEHLNKLTHKEYREIVSAIIEIGLLK